MASQEDINALNGNFKEVYGEVIEDLVPNTDLLFRNDRIKFVRQDGREGLAYNQPVLLQLASSATWGIGPSMNPVVASLIGNASLTATQIATRDQITYNAVMRSMGSKAAFEDSVGLVIKNLFKSHGKFAEIDLLYGNGAITSGVSLGQSTSIVSSSPNAAITISYGTWAPAIFSGFQAAKLDAYQSGIKLNTNAALVIVSVNASPVSNSVGGVVTVSGNASDITALIAASGGAAVDLYWYSAFGNNMTGLEGILLNTGSLFGISATTYDLWKANQYPAGSTQLTFSKLQQAISQGVARGLDEEVITLVNPATFADLVSENAGARRYDSSYEEKKAMNGMKAIEYWGPSGPNEILPHMFCHQGEAFIVPPDQLIKTGAAQGILDSLTGLGQLFLQVPDNTSAEMRLLSDFGLLVKAPAKCILIQNIVNSASV
jgi:hypothetical protein